MLHAVFEKSPVLLFFIFLFPFIALGCADTDSDLRATVEVMQTAMALPTATPKPPATPTLTPEPTPTLEPTTTPVLTITPAPPPSIPATLTIPEVVNQVIPAVVKIRAGGLIGSGTIMTPNGCILTSDHVVENHEQVTVYVQDGHTARVVSGTVIGVDEVLKLAVIKISDDNWPYLKIAKYTPLVGEDAIIIGYSFNFDGSPSVAKGIVSGFRLEGSILWIQTDALISPGDSGGAVVNSKGQFFAVPDHTFKGYQTDNTGFLVALYSIADDIDRLVTKCGDQQAISE